MKPKLTDVEFKHIVRCKDKDCLFCSFLDRQMDDIADDKQLSLKNETPIIAKRGRGKKIAWTDEVIQNALDMRKDGKSYDKIARKCGMSKPTVYNKIKPIEERQEKEKGYQSRI